LLQEKKLMLRLLTFRNLVLVPTSLVLGLVMLLVPTMRQPDLRSGYGLVGTWLASVTATDNSFPPFQFLVTYDGDGGLVGTASNDLSTASLSSPTQGEWVRTGDRSFRWTGRAFSYDAKTNPNGVFFIDENITLDKAGDAYSGTGSFKVVDNGQVTFSGTYTNVATRVTP
jgi:hypothetical protein